MDHSAKLILVDGSSFLYRAYFAAKQGLSNKDGVPTGATYIITRMLKNLVRDYEGHKFIVVFDAKGESFRNEWYPEYKANRPPMPEDLQAQIENIHNIVKAMGLPLISVEGVEADDVLGSYAVQAVKEGLSVLICTGDKDLAQLVNDKVHLKDTMKDLIYDADAVKEKYGVPPNLIIDLLALKGDTTDNIPGLPGVGDVTATLLLNNIGNIYQIKENIDKVAELKFRGSGKFKQKYLDNWSLIELSYRLATIRCDIPLPVAIKDIELPHEDDKTLITIYENLEFTRFAAQQREKLSNLTSLLSQVHSAQELHHASNSNINQNPHPHAVNSQEDSQNILTDNISNSSLPNQTKTSSTTNASSLEDNILSPQLAPVEVNKNKPQVVNAKTKAELVQAATNVAMATKAAKSAQAEQKANPLFNNLSLRVSPHQINPKETVIEVASELSNEALEALDQEVQDNQAFLAQYGNKEKDFASFKLVNTQTSLQNLIDHLNNCDHFVFKIETNRSLASDCIIVGIAFCISEEKVYYLPLNHTYVGFSTQLKDEEVLPYLKDIFENENIKKSSYDIKFDRLVLHFIDIELKGIDTDIMILAHIVNSSTNVELRELSELYLRYTMLRIEQLAANRYATIKTLIIEAAKQYACEKVLTIFRLKKVLSEAFTNVIDGSRFLDFDMQVNEVLYEMEKTGALIDGTALKQQSEELKTDLYLLSEMIYDLAGEEFSITSPKKLGDMLFIKLGIPYPKKTHKVDRNGVKTFSTAEEILSELADDYVIIRRILEHRAVSKMISSYTDKLPKLISKKTGRVHTHFNVAGTITGRLSSSEPNLQNIPARSDYGKKIRSFFIAEKGYKLVSADYSQIELRLIAHYSQDPSLVRAFNLHQDVHRTTAAEVLDKPLEQVTEDERNHAKATNFGLMYGMKNYGLSRQTKMTLAEAKDYIDKYFKKYPAIQKYMDSVVEDARKNGYVTTIDGRQLIIKGIKTKSIAQRNSERSAINAPMQGSAADIIKKAMLEIYAYMQTLNKDDVRFTLQVHDELLFEVKEELVEEFTQKIKDIMENVVTLSVPLEVGIGVADNWNDAH